jgi:hypothetical protein
MSTKTNPSLGAIVLHTLLTLLTGGFWLVILFIWYVLKK